MCKDMRDSSSKKMSASSEDSKSTKYSESNPSSQKSGCGCGSK